MNMNQILDELMLRVAKGLNFGLEAVEEVLKKSSTHYSRFINLKSKYNDLMQYSAINVLPYNELEIGFDRLRNNLISLIQGLQPDDITETTEVSAPQNNALPIQRDNFFQLLDIHFQNLEAILFIEQEYDSFSKKYQSVRLYGREAVFKIYNFLNFQYSRKFESDTEENLKTYFSNYFTNEIGTVEVYLKNIRHLLEFTQNMEVNQAFFMNTLKSLLSRFELSLLFYYGFSRHDENFTDLFLKSGLLTEIRKDTLFNPEHLDWFRSTLR